MSDKEDDGFEVILTAEDYKNYQDMQKQMNELMEAKKKEKSEYEAKIKALEKGLVGMRKEKQQSADSIQKITLECLKLKRQRMELQDKILQLELNSQKCKKAQLQELQNSMVQKMSVEKRVAELKALNEQFMQEIHTLNETLKTLEETNRQLKITYEKQMGQRQTDNELLIQHVQNLKVQLECATKCMEKEKRLYQQELAKITAANDAEAGRLQKHIRELSKQNGQLQETNDKLTKSKKSIEDDLVKSRQSLTKNLEESTYKYLQQVGQKQKTIDELKRQYRSKQNSLQGKIADLERICKANQQAYDLLGLQFKKYKEQQQIKAKKPNAIPAVTKGQFIYSTAIYELLSQYPKLQYQNLKQSIDGLMTLDEQYQHIINEGRSQIAKLNQAKQNLQKELADAHNIVDKQEDELKSLRLLTDEMMKQQPKQNANAQIQLFTLKEKMDHMQQDHKHQMKSLKFVYNEEIQEMQKRLKSRQAQFAAAVQNPDKYIEMYLRRLKEIVSKYDAETALNVFNSNLDQFSRRLQSSKKPSSRPYPPHYY